MKKHSDPLTVRIWQEKIRRLEWGANGETAELWEMLCAGQSSAPSVHAMPLKKISVDSSGKRKKAS